MKRNHKFLGKNMCFFFRFLKLIRLNIVHLPLDFRPSNVLECSTPLSLLFFYLLNFSFTCKPSDPSRLSRVPLFCAPQTPQRCVNLAKHFVIV